MAVGVARQQNRPAAYLPCQGFLRSGIATDAKTQYALARLTPDFERALRQQSKFECAHLAGMRRSS